jgi:hypothetical protein
VSAAALWRRPFFRLAAAGQLIALAALAAPLLRRNAVPDEGGGARLAQELSTGLVGTGRGVIRAARGGQSNRWEAVR